MAKQSGAKFALFSNHPYDGLRYRSQFDSAEDARNAALDAYDDNIPQGRSPSEYEFLVIEVVEVVERGDKRQPK